MKKHVKNTTIGWILDLLFPCYCRGCGKIGSGLCGRCYFYNKAQNLSFCLGKDGLYIGKNNKNAKKDRYNGGNNDEKNGGGTKNVEHMSEINNIDRRNVMMTGGFQRIFACGIRDGILSKMVMEYKFYSRRYYAKVFSKMIFETIGEFGDDEKYIIVPLPTISKHIRERGFDHIGFLCDEMVDEYGFRAEKLLVRANSAVQVGSSAKQRLEQAKGAYRIDSKAKLSTESHYLLVDDVWTTGASMRAAREVLFKALIEKGAKEEEIKISAIVIAKNDGYEFN